LTLVMFKLGFPRLRWFKTLTKENSNCNLARSVRLKLLEIPESQSMVPGPFKMPTPDVPKRPMGAGVDPPSPMLQLPPGHAKPEPLIHSAAVFWEGTKGPTRSGRWARPIILSLFRTDPQR